MINTAAPSTISRLLNMGIEPFLVTASVNMIVAQRLARRVCSDCTEDTEITRQALLDLQVPEELVDSVRPKKGKGCKRCNDTGYKGRVALYEVMLMTEELKEYVLQGYSTAELKHEAKRLGMQTLRMSGINKLIEGMTTFDEITRVTAPD